MRLVLIWFGAFKNAASTYAPGWVRRDVDRFPRAVVPAADTGAVHLPGRDAEAGADGVLARTCSTPTAGRSSRFMEHLADVDPDHTVVMVQVENEVGLLRDSRDRSRRGRGGLARAGAAGADRPPRASTRTSSGPSWPRCGPGRADRTSGTWSEVFGDDWQADEVFMAWGFASYCGALAAAGKAVKPLPMYANAWLGPQPGQPQAGDYPSGGPVGRVIDVWKAAAPSLDLVAPDIYVDDAKAGARATTTGRTTRCSCPSRGSPSAGCSGRSGTTGRWASRCSASTTPARTASSAAACALLGEMEDVVTAAQAEGGSPACCSTTGRPSSAFSLGGYDVVARNARALLGQMLLDAGVGEPPPPPPPPERDGGSASVRRRPTRGPSALVIAEARTSSSSSVRASGWTSAAGGDLVEIDSVEEGRFDAGRWVPGRALNGDERLFLLPFDDLGAVRIRLLRLPLRGRGMRPGDRRRTALPDRPCDPDPSPVPPAPGGTPACPCTRSSPTSCHLLEGIDVLRGGARRS